jgi:FAR-17a/AIG1-like protein
VSQNTSPMVTRLRGFIFILALGFWIYQFSQTSLDRFGWQFRFLTIWGLSFNVVVAGLMLRYSLGYSERTFNPLVSASVVLNAIFVFMYWKLWFIDPSLVNSGGPIVWYQEYYLHALGPGLMVLDAFLILGVFRRIIPTLAVTLAIFIGYIAWIELLVGPRNTFPTGKVTSGMPYPFLNDMALDGRMVFYATTIGTALVFMLIGWAVAAGLRRL